MTSSKDIREASLVKLHGLLDRQLAVVRELKPVLDDKQRALIEHRLDLLHELAERELSLSQRMGLLEQQRHEMVSAIAAKDGGIPNNATLQELLNAIPGSELRGKIASLSVVLGREMQRLNQVNNDNKHLTSNLLDYTKMVMHLLTRGPGGESYSRQGQLAQGGQQRALLDSRA